ncbi:hypothetical protein [Terracidiphilus gabretensis]|uniref:hypothetical protein n=1 Tax=Terracidiphilus gabretensis TaxID=1577687 RepID=UPI00071B8142|nr:hypothetical protein [Terracidiphilus gabretensis]
MSLAKAKRFIIDRILDQAKRDGISLSDVETQMLGFAEESASATDMAVAQTFEREIDDERYEKTVAELIRRAYRRDKENNAIEAWEQPLDALADKDLYLGVMIQRAGISGASGLANLFDWRLLVGIAPALVFVAFGSFIAFSRTGEKLIPNDLLRLVILVICLTAPLLVHRMRSKTRL